MTSLAGDKEWRGSILRWTVYLSSCTDEESCHLDITFLGSEEESSGSGLGDREERRDLIDRLKGFEGYLRKDNLPLS